MVERTDLCGFRSVPVWIIMSQTKICSSHFLEEGSDELSGSPTEELCDHNCLEKIDFTEM